MLTSKDIGHNTEMNGIVDKIGKPYMRITSARFECPSCGTIISVLQEGKRFREPTRCSCGRRGGFKTISTETVEGQDIYVLEQLSDFGYIVYLEKPELIRKLTVIQEGCSVKVTGIPRVEFKKGSAVGDIVLDAKTLEKNRRKAVEDDWDDSPLEDNIITKGVAYKKKDLAKALVSEVDKKLKEQGVGTFSDLLTEDIIDTSEGADSPQEIPNDQD